MSSNPAPNRPCAPAFDPDARLAALIQQGAHLSPVRCGVVHPCDEVSLRGAVDAANHQLIEPLLIGPEAKIRATADQFGIDIKGLQIVTAPHSHAAADLAAAMAAEGKVESLMKGSLHSKELLHAIVATTALRTKRRLSHIFRFEVPLYPKPLFITDAALNIQPTLRQKQDIVQNAIDLAHVLGNMKPKVAILAAVEMVEPDMIATIDAAALCKMADRGQIKGGLLDGPLAFDNAISPEAVEIKHIESKVAGQADILVVPDLESGNMLAKQLEYLAGAISSGIVLGARVPLALTSRAEGVRSRLGSALLAKLVAHHYRVHKP